MSITKEIPKYYKYCHKVEITFDKNRRSKSGRLIPIEKLSGLNHECDARPRTNGTINTKTSESAPGTQEVSRNEGQSNPTHVLTYFKNADINRVEAEVNEFSMIEYLTNSIGKIYVTVLILNDN